MVYFDLCARPENTRADFALAVTDDSLLPLFKKGETVFFRRRVDLQDGDVGLFAPDGEMVIRQYCEDSFGTVYLFAVNRAERDRDRLFSGKDAKELICYGRAELTRQLPLPMD